MTNDYELTFWGGTNKRYRRNHSTFESAERAALKVLANMPNRAAHPAIVYGPNLGRDGKTIT